VPATTQRLRQLPYQHIFGDSPLQTVVIHLGTHKAASTSIQLYLARNRAALLGHGICYPNAPPPTPFAHHALAWRYIRKYSRATDRSGNYSLQQAFDEFNNSACHTLLLSSEDFMNCSAYDGFMPEFFGTLRQVFQRVVVIAYVRDRAAFFAASYNQWVKALVYSGDFQSYLDRVLQGNQAQMHYTRSLTTWADASDTALYMPLPAPAQGHSIEKEFLAALGIDPTRFSSFEKPAYNVANASIGPLALLAYRITKDRLDDMDWFDPYNLRAREPLNTALLSWAGQYGWNESRPQLVDAVRLAAIRQVFGREDERFAQRFFSGPWNEVFDDKARLVDTNECCYEALSQTQRATVDEFVDRAVDLAATLYSDSGSAIKPT
jgi:hypothetical protein